uniref:Alpha-conotoxin LsIA n=1 Tax=Conus limpusi TaxID=1967283 RepID=CA1A_CONLM|nr:RecName: Full=Alpha-conotoxin LsIA [Conus limpusi]
SGCCSNPACRVNNPNIC